VDPVTRAAGAKLDTSSPLADPSARLAAAAIDVILPAVPIAILLPLGIGVSSPALVHASSWGGWALSAILFVVDLVLLHRYGQTIGKRVMGLRIVRTDGSRASLGRIFWARMIAPGVLATIPLLGWIFELVDLLTIFAVDRRTLHDRMADTIVIDLRAPLASPSLADVFS